ncbi:protein YIF1B [Cydia pomonella]|uniref:protein YIF1B n=1 Tax=Cydia pomonella TaxID=82600 RepID=UPI002ADD65DC|nr:protein YIF1B [Cydia pomonella]
MNFNASRNVGQAGGLRKAKRVSDVAAMGAPAPQPPAYSPAPGFSPAPPYSPTFGAPPHQEGIQLDAGQDFGVAQQPPSYGYMGGYPQSPMAAMVSPGQIGSMLQQPVVQDMALQYGNQLAAAGREAVQREIGRYVPVARLRYYFAVDTRYVLRKLMLILFPYTHKEWMVKYDQESPVQPRYDLNAPDLYLPAMGYVTYVLLAGFMLGLQHRFSPEQISMQASSALAYIVFEMLVYTVTLYITHTHTNLRTLDLLAYSGYKYTAMIASLLAALVAGRTGYYSMLGYCSVALSYFLVKTLRVQVLAGAAPEPAGHGYGPAAGPYGPAPAGPYGPAPAAPYGPAAAYTPAGGTKRRVYFLLFVAVTQPLLCCWLTYHLVPGPLPTPLPTR